MIDKKSPKYEHLDMNINLAAGDVIMYMRPETIYGLPEVLIKNVLPAAEPSGSGRKRSISAQSGIDLVGEAAERIQRERERKEKMKKEKELEAKNALSKIEKRSQNEKTVNMKLDIVFSSLQLYICAKQFNICKN